MTCHDPIPHQSGVLSDSTFLKRRCRSACCAAGLWVNSDGLKMYSCLCQLPRFFGSHLIRLRSGSGVSRIWEGFSVPSHRSAYAARASATRLFGWVRPHLQSLSLAARLPDEGCVVHRDQPRQALGTDSTADYDLRSRQALTLSRMLTYKYVDGPALSGTNSANTNASTSPQIQAQDKGSSETPTSSPNTATQQTQLELLATVATSNEIW